jgi:hypothetical protein
MDNVVKVYQLNYSDYWFATSLEEAISTAMESYGLPLEDVYDEEIAKELSQDDLDSLKFTYNEFEPSKTCSFKTELERVIHSGETKGFFATNEW